jgi:hypothetical protein
MTTVIVNPGTFECREKNEPDHVPFRGEDACRAVPESDVSWFFAMPKRKACRHGGAIVAVVNTSSRPGNKTIFLVMMILVAIKYITGLTV